MSARYSRLKLLSASFCVFLLLGTTDSSASEFDLLIHSGILIDGTGNDRFQADIGVKDGLIAAIGNLSRTSAPIIINATGKFVIPGFIDVHGHADDHEGTWRGLRASDPRIRAATPSVSQGITTTVANSDGLAPLMSIAEQMSATEQHGIGINVAYLASHPRARFEAMGADSARPPTENELREMRRILESDLAQGAWGIASVLESGDGRWSTENEILEITKPLREYDGVFIAHPRSQSHHPAWWIPSIADTLGDYPLAPTMYEATNELIQVARRNNIRVSVSHISMRGPDPDDELNRSIRAINKARSEGVQIFADLNIHRANPIGIFSPLIPYWAMLPGPAATSFYTRKSDPRRKFDYTRALRTNLNNSEIKQTLLQDIQYRIEFWGGADNIIVSHSLETELIGRSLAKISESRNIAITDLVVELALSGDRYYPGGAIYYGKFRSPENIRALARMPWVAGNTDASIRLPGIPGFVHPRMYSTFTLWLHRYVVVEKVLSLEEAVRNLTSLAAEIVGLDDRGKLIEGFAADLSVIELKAVRPRATFYDIHQLSEGFDHVLVNGIQVVNDGQLTWNLPGKVLAQDQMNTRQKGTRLMSSAT